MQQPNSSKKIQIAILPIIMRLRPFMNNLFYSAQNMIPRVNY